jgi:anti-sigma-K factor RskA
MNYLTDERRHALSAEYVLGTLRGAARIRYQQLLMQFPQMRETKEQWESHINGLGEHLSPVAPDPIVWDRILKRLKIDDYNDLPDNVVVIPTSGTNWWKTWSMLSSAAFILLAILFIQPTTEVIENPQQFTVVQNTEQKALWLIEIYQQTIASTATQLVEQKASNDYQLWMVPKDGQPPISLGLLAQQGKVTLVKNPLFDSTDIAALAVSLEPLGGSPNGSPTEVLFIAELALL